jgi:hypothetical protein
MKAERARRDRLGSFSFTGIPSLVISCYFSEPNSSRCSVCLQPGGYCLLRRFTCVRLDDGLHGRYEVRASLGTSDGAFTMRARFR